MHSQTPGRLHLFVQQPQRYLANRPHVGRDVLASPAVAAGGGCDQAPLLVHDLHADAVELGFADQGDALSVESLVTGVVEAAQTLLVLNGLQAAHGTLVADRAEVFAWPGIHALGGTVERD